MSVKPKSGRRSALARLRQSTDTQKGHRVEIAPTKLVLVVLDVVDQIVHNVLQEGRRSVTLPVCAQKVASLLLLFYHSKLFLIKF